MGSVLHFDVFKRNFNLLLNWSLTQSTRGSFCHLRVAQNEFADLTKFDGALEYITKHDAQTKQKKW